jgi:hypothetical protein
MVDQTPHEIMAEDTRNKFAIRYRLLQNRLKKLETPKFALSGGTGGEKIF